MVKRRYLYWNMNSLNVTASKDFALNRRQTVMAANYHNVMAHIRR